MLKTLGVWGLQTAIFAGLGLLVGVPWLDPRWLPAGLIAMSVLLVATAHLKTLRAIWLTLVWSAAHNGLAFYWVPAMFSLGLSLEAWKGELLSVPLLFLDMLRGGLPILIATRSFARSRHQWFWAACIAVTVENLIASLFPWKSGYCQLAFPWLHQCVDLLGPDAATFIFYAHIGVLAVLGEWLLEKTGVASWLSRRVTSVTANEALEGTPESLPVTSLLRRLAYSSALGVTLLNLLYSAAAIWYWSGIVDKAPTMRLALIQINPLFPDSNERYRRESNRLQGQVDLICWPECCAGSYEMGLKSLRDPAEVEKKSRDPERGLRPWPEAHCPLLVGGKIYRGHASKPKLLYQAALLIDQQQITDCYFKRYLMPLGEYKPMDRYWPGLSRSMGFTEMINPGEEANPISVNGVKLGVVLCYEDMVPHALRTLTKNGASLLVSLINGAAFFNPTTLEQHRLLAQQRAIECRRYFVRCSTSGETCVISPLGEIVARVPLQSEQTLITEVKLLDASSWYASDDWRSWPGTAFPYVLGILVILRMCIDQRKNHYARLALKAITEGTTGSPA